MKPTIRSAALVASASAVIAACSSTASSSAGLSVDDGPHPRMLYAPEHKARIVARQSAPPFDTLWQRVRDAAAATPNPPTPGAWSTKTWEVNAGIAQANAVLAWALDDQAAAAKAKELLLSFADDFENDDDIDIDISMPQVLIPFVDAWDLLRATPWMNADESREARDRITTVTRKFVARFLDTPILRTTSFVVTQNNHPLRAASAIGYVALAFPDDPDAPRWLDWATDQMDYLLGPKGHYVQSDGAVSEGPFYFGFAYAALMPFLIALDRNSPPDAVHHHTCITRNDVDPWTDNGCVEGEPFTLTNPLRDPTFVSTADWSIALRRPSGMRAELDDARIAILNGAALLTSFGGGAHYVWDWENNVTRPRDTTGWADLTPWYLAYLTDTAAAPPPFRNKFFPAGGQAVFRSGWGTSDTWLMLVADHGPARKTVHNHADGASFALSAYGEDLLIDTGYYKPDALNNPLTTDAPSHNVILIDGAGAPKRGLLDDWGDTDAFLENTIDGDAVAWAEARVSYEQAQIRRGVAFARKRYFVVADRIESAVTTPRAFQWRAHVWAGYDAGGAYAIAGNRLTIDRALGGLEIAATTTAGIPSFVEPPFVALQAPHVHYIDAPGNHAVADATIQAASPGFLVVLAPYAQGATGADGKLTVTAVDAGAGGAAWTIAGGDAGATWNDVAWLRDAAALAQLSVGGHTIETDARFVILSASGDYALVAGGTRVTLDGTALIHDNTAPATVVTR